MAVLRIGLLLFLLGALSSLYGFHRYGELQAQLEEMRAKVALLPQIQAEVASLERELQEIGEVKARLRRAALPAPDVDVVLDTTLRLARETGVALASLRQTRFEALGEGLFLSGFELEVEGRYPSVQAFWETLRGKAPFQPFLERVSFSVRGPLLASQGSVGVLVYEER